MTDAANAQLIKRLRTGHRGACELFVRQTYGAIYSLHRWLGGDEQAAADLTQDTFAAFWQSLSRFEGRCSLQTWLRRIAVRTARRYFLREGANTRPTEALVLEAVPDGSPGPEQTAIWHATLDEVYEEVLLLDPRLREAFALRYREEMPFAEIAEALGIDVGLAKWRVYEARRRVLRTLRAREEEVA